VLNLGSKKDSEDIFNASSEVIIKAKPQQPLQVVTLTPSLTSKSIINDYDWDVVDEYDPLWPNEYEKLIKERRDKDRDKDRDRNRDRDRDNKRDNGRENRDRKRKHEEITPKTKYAGFGGRAGSDDEYDRPAFGSGDAARSGAAIAPPKSLQEDSPPRNSGGAGSSFVGANVAAKIMAKYGFKDGQGLGKQEQGMSIALQVEKTSKRGGRIIHEKELLMPPPVSSSPPPPGAAIPPPAEKPEPSITEIMKSPSKVVLLRVSI
jgi:splicing factor 45